MRSLLRLFSPTRIAPKPLRTQRDSVGCVLDDGRRVDVLRVRDARAKRLKLSVDERGARLTLPLRASLVAGDRFLHEHRSWLTAQFAAHAQLAGSGLQRDVTDALPLRGADVPLRWDSGRVARIEFDATAGLLFSAPAQARADVGRWLPRYLHGLPRPPRRIVFKRTSSQWGSLAPDGTLSLDLALVLARPSAFEYVLVHELCHLLHADHSRRFWDEVDIRCPAWRDERAYFHDQGRRLKGRLRSLLAG